MGRLKVNAPAVVKPGDTIDPTAFADPVPQALVLTAIVISFATTALFLVVLLASRGLTGTDHVDGGSPNDDPCPRAPRHCPDRGPTGRRRGAAFLG